MKSVFSVLLSIGVALLALSDGETDTVLVPAVSNPGGDAGCTETADVPSLVGGTGDFNMDGVVNQADVDALAAIIPEFTDGLGNPGDLNGDGVLDNDDVTLLQAFVDRTLVDDQSDCSVYVAPTEAPSASPTASPSKAPTDAPTGSPVASPPDEGSDSDLPNCLDLSNPLNVFLLIGQISVGWFTDLVFDISFCSF